MAHSHPLRPWCWRRCLRHSVRPTESQLSIDLYEPGAYFRRPGGNIERPDDQKQTIKWAAWNIGNDPGVDGNPGVWDTARSLWASRGIADFPWLHCRTLADVDRLVTTGKQYGSSAIGLNIEDVQKDFTAHGVSLQDIAQKIAGWSGDVHMATLPWVPNGQGWSALARCVAALEIMPDEQANIFPGAQYDPKVVSDCLWHAFDEGLTKVTLMFKTKPPWAQASYGEEFAIVHSLYTGDDIEPSAAGWKAWAFDGEPLVPVPPNGGEDMEKIGYDDGITATMNRLRDLDPDGTRLVKDAKGKWPSIDTLTIPLKDWKAYDKFERDQRFLKDFHDAQVT